MSKSIAEHLNQKANNFDFLRLFAATLVIFSHSYPLTGHAEVPVPFVLNSYGSLGVKIFFLISGFLIMSSFLRNPSVVMYFKARILRVIPGLLFALALSSLVLGPLVSTLSPSDYFNNHQTYDYFKMLFLYSVRYILPGVFEGNVYPQSVNGSLWTLEYEFTFYIMIAILGVTRLLVDKRVVLFVFFMFLTLTYYQTWLVDKSVGTIHIRDFFEFGLYFSAGMLLYSFRDYIRIDRLVAIFCVVLLLFSTWHGGLGPELFVFIGGYLIIYLALSPDIRLTWVSRFGDFSYGMYIFAFPVQQLVVYLNGGTMKSPFMNFIISFIITLILSIISWHLVEKHALKLKRISISHLFRTKFISQDRTVK
ncbi:acyltransferase [Paenibacillus rhizovicinus]|uniref:Acyltransferase n=1 Tax=Paenibacillus rhizovicinus TaxID=2704463 RepID=A0A6C0NZ78_9BACL|nr:acyltransferase [Paenibacillus rhizovicinus]QHW31544.1 acyltransferase [Paenibacillus rhizovicinus]